MDELGGPVVVLPAMGAMTFGVDELSAEAVAAAAAAAAAEMAAVSAPMSAADAAAALADAAAALAGGGGGYDLADYSSHLQVDGVDVVVGGGGGGGGEFMYAVDSGANADVLGGYGYDVPGYEGAEGGEGDGGLQLMCEGLDPAALASIGAYTPAVDCDAAALTLGGDGSSAGGVSGGTGRGGTRGRSNRVPHSMMLDSRRPTTPLLRGPFTDCVTPWLDRLPPQQRTSHCVRIAIDLSKGLGFYLDNMQPSVPVLECGRDCWHPNAHRVDVTVPAALIWFVTEARNCDADAATRYLASNMKWVVMREVDRNQAGDHVTLALQTTMTWQAVLAGVAHDPPDVPIEKAEEVTLQMQLYTSCSIKPRGRNTTRYSPRDIPCFLLALLYCNEAPIAISSPTCGFLLHTVTKGESRVTKRPCHPRHVPPPPMSRTFVTQLKGALDLKLMEEDVPTLCKMVTVEDITTAEPATQEYWAPQGLARYVAVPPAEWELDPMCLAAAPGVLTKVPSGSTSGNSSDTGTSVTGSVTARSVGSSASCSMSIAAHTSPARASCPRCGAHGVAGECANCGAAAASGGGGSCIATVGGGGGGGGGGRNTRRGGVFVIAEAAADGVARATDVVPLKAPLSGSKRSRSGSTSGPSTPRITLVAEYTGAATTATGTQRRSVVPLAQRLRAGDMDAAMAVAAAQAAAASMMAPLEAATAAATAAAAAAAAAALTAAGGRLPYAVADEFIVASNGDDTSLATLLGGGTTMLHKM